MDFLQKSLIGLSFASCLAVAGCGMPGTPQPPSLDLPDHVQDLSIQRVGNEVHLHWTMPRRNTDRLPLKGTYTAHLCMDEVAGKCTPVADLPLAPDVAGDYRHELPAVFVSGPLRPLFYRVEVRNHAGHSSGASAPAVTLAGSAPAAVSGLSAQVHAEGVVLRWDPTSTATIRLHRKLLSESKSEAKKTKDTSSLAAPQPEMAEQSLLVKPNKDSDPGKTLDASALLNRKYQYLAERILQLRVANSLIEVSSVTSNAVTVDTRDVFPPAIPSGLVTILVPEEKSIDLSWAPDSELDLAGYIVYRSDGTALPIRISPAQPLLAPAFRDTKVLSGHRYSYAVSAVDRDGNESARSHEVQEIYP